jgi:hypothetical protein
MTLVLVAHLTYSQEESKKYLRLKQNLNYRDAYILNRDSVKIDGIIRDNIFDTHKYSSINFVHKNGIKRKYFPNEIRGFGYSIYKYESDNSSFYEIVEKGKKVTLYMRKSVSTYSVPAGPGMGNVAHSYSTDEYFLKRPGEKSLMMVKKKDFKKEFSSYFGDCDELTLKILSGELTYKDIKEIVQAYNYCRNDPNKAEFDFSID